MVRMAAAGTWLVCVICAGAVACHDEDEDKRFFPCDADGPHVRARSQDDAWTQYGRDSHSTHCVNNDYFDGAHLEQAWEVANLPGATSTPVVKGHVVYFGDWNGTLHAVDTRNGAEIWSRTVTPGAPIRSTPAIAGDTIYAAFDVHVAAYDRKTGTLRWTKAIETHPMAYIESSPIYVDGRIVIGTASFELTQDLDDYTFRGSVVGLDAASGTELWRVHTSQNDATSGAGSSVWSSAAVDSERKLVFIGTGNAYEEPAGPLSDSLLAINYETGALIWHNQFTKDDVYTVPDLGPGYDYDVGAAPTLYRLGHRDVVAAGSKAGTFKAIDRDTGHDIWAIQLNKGSDVGGVMVSAAYAAGVLFVNSNNWVDFRFLIDGQHSPNDTSTTFAVDAATGRVLWRHDLPAPMFGAITLANGIVYQGLIDGSLFALAGRDGKERWKDKLPGSVGAGVSVAGDSLFVSYGLSFFKVVLDPGQEPSGVRAYR